MRFDDLKKTVPACIEGVTTAAKHIDFIVSGLIGFAAAEQTPRMEPTDLNAVVKASVALMSNVIEAATREFRSTLEEGLPPILGSYSGLEQVVINLLQNACNALRSTDSKIHVTTCYQPAEDHVILSVRDEGIGMSEKVLAHVRDPFFTTRREEGGLGLGIPISLSIVEAHGGDMRFGFRAGEGHDGQHHIAVHCTFTPRGGFMTGSPSPGFAIAIVDDEQPILDAVSAVLQSVGITNIIGIRESTRLLEVMNETDVGLILLDLAMPRLSGEELIPILKQDHPEVPIIVITGNHDVDKAVACMKAGVEDYLAKPVEPAKLIATVRRFVEIQELRRENAALGRNYISDELAHPEAFSDILTAESTVRRLFRYIETISATEHVVLITGETGVGKELIAQAIHRLSKRAGEFVAVNVAGSTRQCSPTPSSATVRVPSPARRPRFRVSSNARRAEHCSWTRSAISRRAARSSCCVSWKAGSTTLWAPTSCIHRRRVSSWRQMRTWKKISRWENSAKTCTTE